LRIRSGNAEYPQDAFPCGHFQAHCPTPKASCPIKLPSFFKIFFKIKGYMFGMPLANIHPSKEYSFQDIKVGIPSLCIIDGWVITTMQKRYFIRIRKGDKNTKRSELWKRTGVANYGSL